MSTAHHPDLPHLHHTNKPLVVTAVVVAALGALLTAFTVYAGYDLATNAYVGGEVLFMQLAIAIGGYLSVLAWTGAIALLKTARRDVRAGPRRLLVAGLLGALGSLVVALVGAVPVLVIGAGALAVTGAVVALVGAVRM